MFVSSSLSDTVAESNSIPACANFALWFENKIAQKIKSKKTHKKLNEWIRWDFRGGGWEK